MRIWEISLPIFRTFCKFQRNSVRIGSETYVRTVSNFASVVVWKLNKNGCVFFGIVNKNLKLNMTLLFVVFFLQEYKNDPKLKIVTI